MMTLREIACAIVWLGLEDFRLISAPVDDPRERLWTATAYRRGLPIENTDSNVESAVIGLLNHASTIVRNEHRAAKS